MPQISGLGHLGLYCNDLGTMRDFYARVLGLTISDEDLERGICFLSAAPDAEHHELALVRANRSRGQPHRAVLHDAVQDPSAGEPIDLDRPDSELLAFAKSFEETNGPPRGAQQPVGR